MAAEDLARKVGFAASTDRGCRLILVRHGETKSNTKFDGVDAADVAKAADGAVPEHKVLNTPLTERGFEQSLVVAEYLAGAVAAMRAGGRNVKVTIMSSPLSRARYAAGEFAAMLSDGYFVGPYIEPVKMERYGEEQVAAAGVDTHVDFADYEAKTLRVARGIWEKEFRSSDAETHLIVVFTHSLFMSYITQTLLDMPVSEKPKFHHPNICMSEFGFADGEWHALYIASTHHIPADMITGGHGMNTVKE